MGQTAECEVEIDGKRDRGEALLESTELTFRGKTRLRIPFATMKKIAAADGTLSIAWKAANKSSGSIALALGTRAAVWAAKIKNPPGRMDKLGVKPGMKVAVWGALEPAALDELRARAEVHVGKPRGGEAMVFLVIETPKELGHITLAAETIAPDGAIWVVRQKGKGTRVTEAESMAAGRAAGLVDTKVVSFSDTHTADRYVIPVARRKPTAAKRA
jgi:hypothetical protein